jgi:Tfp pilus assembly protein FimT
VRPRIAFTLFELILVLSLLVMLAALAPAALDSLQGTFRVTAAADAVRAAWAEARSHAINEGCAYRFSVVPGAGNYRIAPDAAGFWPDPNSQSPAATPGQGHFVLEDALPRGVRFSTSDANGDAPADNFSPGSVDPSAWVRVATFLPDGTAQDDAEIVFRARGARAVSMKLRGLTGAVRTRTLP